MKKEIPINPQTLGEHLLRKRLEKGMLQKEVAQVLNVSEDTITYWENGRSQPQVHFYPSIIAFLEYYPFAHEVESIAGKLQQVRFCNGWTCKELAEVLTVDPGTVIRWERRKSAVSKKAHSIIMQFWSQLPRYVKQQHRSE